MKRMIDAATWANEKFGELPMVARLLLIGMITIANDQGCALRFAPTMIWAVMTLATLFA